MPIPDSSGVERGVPDDGKPAVSARDEAKRQQRAEAKRERLMKELESRIQELEERRKRFEKVLADPEFYKDAVRSQPYMEGHREASTELEELYARWVELQDEAGGRGRLLDRLEKRRCGLRFGVVEPLHDYDLHRALYGGAGCLGDHLAGLVHS